MDQPFQTDILRLAILGALSNNVSQKVMIFFRHVGAPYTFGEPMGTLFFIHPDHGLNRLQ